MRPRADERGVTVQIGTVLLFAVLILLMSIYQASVVPQQNEQVEFNHNERVQGQLQDLRDELRRTAVTGRGGSSSVELGTRYPVRALFVNPPPPSGALRTTSSSNATIRNATASGEVGDYWNGDDRNFSTRGLVYEPDYRVYQNPPTTVYRNGVLYRQFESANRTLGDQQLIRGDTVSLVALTGDFSEASSESATVDVRPVSAATRTVTVRNASANENVTLVLPTRLPAERAAGLWSELLADEERVQAVAPAERSDAVRVVLEPGTYELELAKVGVGADATGVGPHYVTDVRGDNATVTENGRRELVVGVRDRFDNPVSGARVNATLVSGLSGDAIASQGESDGESLTELTTDADGRVTIRYEAPDDFDGPNRAVKLRASMASVPDDGAAFDPGSRRNLSFDLSVVNTDGSGLGGGDGPGGGHDGAYRTLWDDSQIDAETGAICYANDTCRYDRAEGASVTLTAETGPVADDARIGFATNDTGVGTFNVSDRTTNGAGRAQVNLDTSGTGNVTVYTWSGGSGDALAVDVYDSGGGGPGEGDGPPIIETFEVQDQSEPCEPNPVFGCAPNSNVAEYDISWEVTDGDGNLDSVTVYVNESDTMMATYSGENGQETYTEPGGYEDDYIIKLVAEDADGNRACEVVTDTANGDDADQTRSSC